MLPGPSNLALSRPAVKYREVLLTARLGPPNVEHSANYLPVRHKHVCHVALSLKDMMITTNLVSGRGPFLELSVIGEESCELVALCVSRLQAGLVENPSGRRNTAVGTWCVKQACHT